MDNPFDRLRKKGSQAVIPSADSIKQIIPPKCRWVQLDRFKLADIPKFFEPTDYQRQMNRAHTYRIVESILNNTFYDNTIRVLRVAKNRFKVIDGQHRLGALWILHTQYALQYYALAIQIFEPENQREIFRKINAGKSLNPGDILKTYENEGGIKYLFFEELRGSCTHVSTKKQTTFVAMLQAISLSRGHMKVIHPREFLEMLSTITQKEVNQAYRLSVALNDSYTRIGSGKIYNAMFIRLLYLIGEKYDWNIKEYKEAMIRLFGNEEFLDLTKQRISTHFLLMVNRCCNILKIEELDVSGFSAN